MSEFNKKFAELIDSATKLVQDSSHRALKVLDVEREKAKMRSEIGNTKNDLTKAYEKLGRAYYDIKEKGKDVSVNELIDQIRTKENKIQLLNNKLKQIEEETTL